MAMRTTEVMVLLDVGGHPKDSPKRRAGYPRLLVRVSADQGTVAAKGA
jgi:hypothetical protein